MEQYILQTFQVPEGTSGEKLRFRVTANGQEVGLYSDINAWKKEVNFGYFNFDKGLSVAIEIEPFFHFETVKVLPEKYGIEATNNNGKVSFSIDEPNKDMTFVFDNDYQGYVLHLITNPVDHDAPTGSSDNLLYIGPGYHGAEEFQGLLTIKDDMTLYLDGGAVVNCPVCVKGKNVTIKGCGMIMMDPNSMIVENCNTVVLNLAQAEHVHVSGIICHAHRNPNWTTLVFNCSDVSFEHYRVISTRYASTDGLGISNSQNITVKNCFLRACDDAITIKGLMLRNECPNLAPPNTNIHISDTILWNDCNNAMVLGEESNAEYSNISFKNVDVLYSCDDRDHHGQLKERSAISIVCLDGTYFRDILWENIRINECQRMICFTFLDSFWFGTIPGHQSHPGGIDGVILRNIRSQSNNTNSISNKIILNGWDSQKTVNNVSFQNVTINGKKVMSLTDDCFEMVQNVGSVTFE